MLAALALTGLTGWGLSSLGGCTDDALGLSDGSADADPTLTRDATPIDVPDGSKQVNDASSSPPPSCEKYCDLVMKNCTGAQAQYTSEDDCLAFCKHLPLGDPGDDSNGTVACRQYFAGNAARTSPQGYCATAGPFGGGVCGDRCTAFCDVALSACSPDSGTPSYANQGDCKTACVEYAYKDAGPDSGGETPTGPTSGNSLNCRLYYLRQAVKNPAAHCEDLQKQSPTCQ